MTEKSTFMQMKENEREKRKTLIIEAAMNLFRNKPFHEIGIRDVASEAVISPASIYRYFPTRDDLFVESLIRNVMTIEKRLRARIVEKAHMDKLVMDVVDYMVDNEPAFQMLYHFLLHGEEGKKAHRRFNAFMLHFNGIFEGVVIKPEKVRGSGFNSRALFASLAGIVMTFRHYPGKTPPERRDYMHKLSLVVMHEGLRIGAFETIKNPAGQKREKKERLKKAS